jgi:diguanylate cyclase (GGDEF)-like protein
MAITADFFVCLLQETPGKTVRLLMYGFGFFYFFFLALALYYLILFIDYMIFKDTVRFKKILSVINILAIIHFIILLVNIKHKFYFNIEKSSNILVSGDRHFIRMLISYCPIFFALCELIYFSIKLKRFNLLFIFFLLGLFMFGLFAFPVIGSAKLIWPCITAVLLYSYFLIVQSDTRIDSLTGIGNRYSFNEFTDKLARHKSGESWAVVMIDMDHFKAINDTFGHMEGDNALRDMAAIIKSSIRKADFAARYGGDEFVLATRMENGIADLMNSIKDAIAKHNKKNQRPYTIDISYGFGVYTADGKQPIEGFLNHIDELMYKQKEERRRTGDKKPV